MNFYGPSGPCVAVNFTAYGEWQGNEGYYIVFRAQDAGEPGFGDNVRIELHALGGAMVYDTHWANEFSDESDCYGTARTSLDHGNLRMVLPS